MRPLRVPLFLRLIPVGVALVVALPVEAPAQSFFEELFGIKPKPPAPPRAAPPPSTAPPASGEAPAEVAKPAAPAPARPVVLKAPGEDNVLGQELMLNGLAGSLKLERAGAGMTARIILPGSKVSQPGESCRAPLGDGAALALSSEGRPEGVARYEAAGGDCPLRFDILEGGVLVTPLSGARICSFAATDCAATPGGMWGPAAAALIPRSSEFDSARGVADKAVRDNYKVMTQRLRGQDVRPVVTEQAAFSSDREQTCRTYAREGAHGFCNVRFTEARALALAARLGVNTSAPTQGAAPRARRKAPPPAVDGLNPDAGSPFGE